MTAMDVNEIRQRLEQELRSTGSRLRERGWLVDPRRLNEGTPAEDYWTRLESTPMVGILVLVGLLSAVFAIRSHRRLHGDPDGARLGADRWWMQAGGTSAVTWAATIFTASRPRAALSARRSRG